MENYKPLFIIVFSGAQCFAMAETLELDLICSPNNYQWFGNNDIPQRYPICSSWCASWYAACKHVNVCTDDEHTAGAACPTNGNDAVF